jgi:hypothetical protein
MALVDVSDGASIDLNKGERAAAAAAAAAPDVDVHVDGGD